MIQRPEKKLEGSLITEAGRRAADPGASIYVTL